ncbi:MAG: AraC family transcriptional regulator [Roseibium sp.]
MPFPAGYSEAIKTPEQSRNIESVWSYVAEQTGTSTILPDGRCDVILRYNTRPEKPACPILTGPATKPYQVVFEPGDAWVGVRLRPGHGQAIWAKGLPGARNQVMRGPAALKWLPELKVALDCLPVLSDLRTILGTLPSLQSTSADEVALGPVIEQIHMSGGRVRIEALAGRLDCSTRNLNRHFTGAVGISAKDYSRLAQFHRALNLVRFHGLKLVDAAFEAGYADQSHMARAMKTFGGFPPSRIPEDLSLPNLFGE